MSKKQAKPKMPPRRVPSDDLTVLIDETAYHPHAGEHVDYIRGIPWGYHRVVRASVDIDTKDAKEVMTSWSNLVGILPDCIVGWNWTDNNGEPLPQPHRNLAAFDTLNEEELLWLWQNVVPRISPQS